MKNLSASQSWKDKYQKAHEVDFMVRYPTAYADGHYTKPKVPDPKSTNGITRIIQNFLMWSGHYANRINVAGRQVGRMMRTEAGNVFDDRKWIKSSTRKGTSDLVCSIKGQMVCIEVKNAATKDRLSVHQEKERSAVRKSGTEYVIISSIEQFFEWYYTYSAS